MPRTDQAVRNAIYEAAGIRYDMEIRQGHSSVEAQRRAVETATQMVQHLPEANRPQVLRQVRRSLEGRTT